MKWLERYLQANTSATEGFILEVAQKFSTVQISSFFKQIVIVQWSIGCLKWDFYINYLLLNLNYIYDACITSFNLKLFIKRIFTNRNTIVPFTIKLIYKMLVFIYYFYIGWISNLHPRIVNSEVCTGTPQYQIYILVIKLFYYAMIFHLLL